MGLFIKKILSYGLIVSVITALINGVYVGREKYNSALSRIYENIPYDIKICNFGSSHGQYGYNYEDVSDVECFNFGLVSQSLAYDEKLFENYSAHISEGGVAFITISYFSLYGVAETMKNNFAEKNKRYYLILPADLITDYDIKTDIYTRYFPALSAGAVNLIDVLIKSWFVNDEEDYWDRDASNVNLKEDAEAAYIRHLGSDNYILDENGNRVVNQDAYIALVNLIDGCYANGIIPILVTTPYLHEYTDEVSRQEPEFFESFYSLINNIKSDTGIEYYDYAFDERFSNNPEWFGDVDHLNRKGARQFVDILLNEAVHLNTPEPLLQ